MLNTILIVFCFSLTLIFRSTPAQDKVVKITGLSDALAMAGINFHDTISDVFEGNIKSEYYTWIYCHNRLKVLDEKRALFSDFMEISELHYKSGETDIISKAGVEIEYLKAELQYSDARNDVLVSENNLKKLLFMNDDIRPVSDSLGKYYLPPEMIEMPENDSLIDDYSDFLLQKEYINLGLLIRNYEERLAYYGKALGIAQQLVDVARLRYESEDIEYIDYIDLMNGAIDLRLKYLKTLNSYNHAVIKMELYANKCLYNEKN